MSKLARPNARIERVSRSFLMYVDLLWDGGVSWTATKAASTLGRTEKTYVMGSALDTWGRSLTDGELSNVRGPITDVAAPTQRDSSLDWVAVRVSYLP